MNLFRIITPLMNLDFGLKCVSLTDYLRKGKQGRVVLEMLIYMCVHINVIYIHICIIVYMCIYMNTYIFIIMYIHITICIPINI